VLVSTVKRKYFKAILGVKFTVGIESAEKSELVSISNRCIYRLMLSMIDGEKSCCRCLLRSRRRLVVYRLWRQGGWTASGRRSIHYGCAVTTPPTSLESRRRRYEWTSSTSTTTHLYSRSRPTTVHSSRTTTSAPLCYRWSLGAVCTRPH